MYDDAMNYMIKDAQVCDPADSCDTVATIFIEDGILRNCPSFPVSKYHCISGPNLIVTPGFVDIHVHFREPGGEDSETMITGAKAAARGGFTDVVTMPNTTPPIDTPERLTDLLRRSEDLNAVIHPSACATVGRLGRELTDMRGLSKAGACCFTDDGSAVASRELMRNILSLSSELNCPLLQHAVDPDISKDGVIRDCPLALEKGLPVFNPDSEISIVKRDIELTRETGGHLHIQHISTAGAVSAIREALKKNIHVTCEATPHHLSLSVEDISLDNADLKMNPPLGTESDRQALLQGVSDGTISCLATDHAPHSAQKKAGGFRDAAFGITGLETAAAVTFEVLVSSGIISLNHWVRLWTEAPSRIIGLPFPSLQTGAPANITVFRSGGKRSFGKDDFMSGSSNSPFIGRRLFLDPILTVCRGKTTWSSADG